MYIYTHMARVVHGESKYLSQRNFIDKILVIISRCTRYERE